MNVKKSILAASCLAIVSTGNAGAQKPGGSLSGEPAASSGLEEIVVTARRREEKLQTVPIAISAVTGETLREHSIANAVDLGKLIPSLNTAQTTRDLEGFEIRGMSNNNASAQGQSPTITPYFAEVPFPIGDGAGVGRFYDLEGVQVLKGPQGTLFGRNSTGGAILLQPRKPGNGYDGYASLQVGNYGDVELEAAADIPVIADKFLIRVAGNRAERDGFTRDVLNGKDLDNRDYWAGRISAELRPTDDFENYVVVDGLYSHSNGSSEVMQYLNPNAVFSTIKLGPLGTVPLTLGRGPLYTGLLDKSTQVATAFAAIKAGALALFSGDDIARYEATQRALGIRAVQAGNDPLQKIESDGIADIARWDLSETLTLRNIFGYREYRQLIRSDLDGTPLPLIGLVAPRGWNVNIAQYSEEMQLQGKSFDNSLVWVTGLFGLYSHAAGLNRNVTVQFGNPLFGETRPTTRTESLYAQGTYDLGHSIDSLQGLKFTAGYRFTWDYRQLDLHQTKANGSCSAPGADLNCAVSVSSHGTQPSWTVGLDYQVTPDTLIYVTHRRGFRAGGLNTQSLIASQIAFKPETVMDVEIGVKSDWQVYGMKGRLNVAAFNSDYRNKQQSQSYSAIINGSPITTNLIVNAGDATIQGVETDLTIVPIDDLELRAAWAYTKASFDKYVIIATGQSVPGQTYPSVPLNRVSLGATYTLPLPDTLGSMSVGAVMAYQTHQYLGVFPTDPPETTIGSGYTTLDLNLNWKGILGRPLDLTLFANNVTDTVYKLGGYPIYGVAGFAAFVYGEPTMYGAKLKYSW